MRVARALAVAIGNFGYPNFPAATIAVWEQLRLGVLAEPKLAARVDFPDAIAAGFGVTEYARSGKAQIKGLCGGYQRACLAHKD
jgi:hypothetical protein